MADVTVSQLAETVGAPVDRLLQQMQEADLPPKQSGRCGFRVSKANVVGIHQEESR